MLDRGATKPIHCIDLRHALREFDKILWTKQEGKLSLFKEKLTLADRKVNYSVNFLTKMSKIRH